MILVNEFNGSCSLSKLIDPDDLLDLYGAFSEYNKSYDYATWELNWDTLKKVRLFRWSDGKYMLQHDDKKLALWRIGTLLGVPVVVNNELDYGEVVLSTANSHLFVKCPCCQAPLVTLKCDYCGSVHISTLR